MGWAVRDDLEGDVVVVHGLQTDGTEVFDGIEEARDVLELFGVEGGGRACEGGFREEVFFQRD